MAALRGGIKQPVYFSQPRWTGASILLGLSELLICGRAEHFWDVFLDGSNEYPQSMFWSKNKKNRYTPANPNFTIYITWTCFPDADIHVYSVVRSRYAYACVHMQVQADHKYE